jgi:hypothetical protein
MSLIAPFLKSVSIIHERKKPEQFLFNTLDFLTDNFSMEFDSGHRYHRSSGSVFGFPPKI